MAKIPTKPEDLFWESGKGDLNQALQFLIDTRNYVAQLTPPEDGYMQHAHSDDRVAVGGDIHRPAVLDASYPNYNNDHYMSISVPIWTPAQDDINWFKRPLTLTERFKKNVLGKEINTQCYKINTGFTGINLQESFCTLLKSYDIEYDSDMTKLGFSRPEGTYYVETTTRDMDEFLKARKIIQAYVHGNAQTPAELKADIDKALELRLPQPASVTTTKFGM